MYKLLCVLKKSNLKKTLDFAVIDVPLGVGSVISDRFGNMPPFCEAGKS